MSSPTTLVVVFVCGVIVGVGLDDLLAIPLGKDRRTMKQRLKFDEARAWIRKNWSYTLLPALVIVSVAISGLTSIRAAATESDARALSACVADYNEQFSKAYRARVSSSTQASDALDEIVRAVAARDRARIEKAVTKYVQLRDKVKADQAANPYPPLPSDYCGPEVMTK